MDLASDEAARTSATAVARGTLGTADAQAPAREAHARALLLQTELAPDEPMSATLTVYDDERVRMRPSIGTAPGRVLGVLEESLPALAPDLAQTAVRRPFTGGEVVRAHRIEETVEVEDGAEFTRRRLVAQYWYPQPDSKHLVLVVLSTPLGDIPHALLSYFDAIVEVSRFAAPVAAAPLQS